jgi:hypothetical protein
MFDPGRIGFTLSCNFALSEGVLGKGRTVTAFFFFLNKEGGMGSPLFRIRICGVRPSLPFRSGFLLQNIGAPQSAT